MFKLSTHALDSSVTTCLLVPQTSMRMMEDINQDAALTSLVGNILQNILLLTHFNLKNIISVPQSVCVCLYDVKNEFYETQEFAHTCVATKSSLNQLRIRKAFSAHVQMVQQHTWVALRSILSKFYFTTVTNRLWNFTHFREI